ncbi:MAG: DUF493 domain-containing protein [Gammaproteobacteria bacterium]|nr:DUF493 domain-containing protein [Gammaproteobacteria bacterium]MCP5425109.1 DUF493 domain-containing protein [Gammaproteobacteria bacterium]
MNSDTLLRFPCDFPIKAMGLSNADFPDLVTEIVGRHAPDLDVSQTRVQSSRQGRYQSVTVTIRAQSREQLDAIYRDLSAAERVVMAL